MPVDSTGSEASAASARAIAARKREAEIEEQRLQMDLAKAGRERKEAVISAQEKTDKDLVEISKNATNQMEAMKRLNSARVHALDENTQKNYEELSKKTAEELKRLDAESFRAIQSHKAGTMEKIKNVTDRGEDPFYRLKSLEPVMTENEKEFLIKLKLPEHEASNLYVSGEGPYLKLTLSRRFQDNVTNEEGNRTSRTNSFQSVVEQLAMPSAYDSRKIERSYADGVVTIKVPKQVFGEEPQKMKAAGLAKMEEAKKKS